ncbi:MAG: sulfotransferase [Phycisphaerae bacterium]|nr:sulfotransferase [Phycisphaerae bacterium]
MNDILYILSPSYSGSTLLTFLLGTHPAIGTIGELKATSMGDIDQYLCSCGQNIRQCGFWTRIAEELDRRHVPFDLADFGTDIRGEAGSFGDRLLRAGIRGPFAESLRGLALAVAPGPRRALRQILEKNRVLAEVVCEAQDARIFLDGSKDPIRLKWLLTIPQWNIRVLYLIRDGRGVSNSYMRHYNCGMDKAAVEWRRTHLECERILRTRPSGSVLKVHYEDLCRAPGDTLDRIFRFLDLESAPACDFRSVQQHILGNAMRLGSTAEITLDEKWRTMLTEEDLRRFDAIAGGLNHRYGYR